MTLYPNDNEPNEYYSGGLAELVSSPSNLTYSFFRDWFTGKQSIGKAMKLLHMPCESSDIPLLEVINQQLFVNLHNEEKTLYQKTIFHYKKQLNENDTPHLTIAYKKLINPLCLLGTLEILLTQSRWIANPKDVILSVKKSIDDIAENNYELDINQLDTFLGNTIWPAVIAVGLLAEFFNQFLTKEAKEEIYRIHTYISIIIAKDDWFFRSLSDQEDVRTGKITYTKYLQLYGIRADKDYELAAPRWHEIREIIKKRIEKDKTSVHVTKEETPVKDKKLMQLIHTNIEIQLLRSEAKRKALIYINQLRQLILEKTKYKEDIQDLTKNEIIHSQPKEYSHLKKTTIAKQTIESIQVSSGKGTSVSQGQAEGKTLIIDSSQSDIPENTIGIFPNASPEFSMQYTKCKGMIFLRGGQTSHGAIVAREFGIPAIIDQKAQGIRDGIHIFLNATSGDWHTV